MDYSRIWPYVIAVSLLLVLWKFKRIGPEDLEAVGASTAAAPK